jgi:membrane protein YdbS with pleckstrin-like domain
MPDPNSPHPSSDVTPPVANEPASTASHAEPGDEEIVYFDGRPTLRADQFKAIGWLVLGLALVALPILAWLYEWGWWRWWLTLASLLIAAAAITIPWLKIVTTRYRITNYRIDYERGVLTKKIDTLELWHVDDIEFRQGLLDRMMGVGNLFVLSNDKSNPRLELWGVPRPREIFDALKQRVIAVKRQRGVIKMDTGM